MQSLLGLSFLITRITTFGSLHAVTCATNSFHDDKQGGLAHILYIGLMLRIGYTGLHARKRLQSTVNRLGTMRARHSGDIERQRPLRAKESEAKGA